MFKLRLKKKNNGFTLLELLVVIGITVTAGALGIYGLITFRETAILKQAGNELFTNVESIRNKARNSVLSIAKSINNDPLEAKVDAFAIVFEDGNYSSMYCDRSDSTSIDYTCAYEKQNLKSEIFTTVDIGLFEESGYQCAGVLFEGVTGDLSLFANKDSVTTEIGVCIIAVELGGVRQILILDGEKDEISLKVD